MILIPPAGVMYVQLVLNQFVVMENRRFEERKEPEIAYSRSVKAGKRIYYLDVKKAKNDDLYLCITESKKKQGLQTRFLSSRSIRYSSTRRISPISMRVCRT